MADIIQLLPDFVANQIAAGEVVQRPASAVKELIENALDAGSISIIVAIKEGGKTLIQVIDKGNGMTETDAIKCFERHATSKISSASDLFKIRSMGFRGEALASIAAVAQVCLKTKLADLDLGTEVVIEGGEIKGVEFVSAPTGTSVAVKNLFFNIPARRNFLKSNQVEFRHILEEFQRQALSHSEVFFSLSHNDTELLHLPKSGLKQRIVHLFGNSYAERLLPVEEETGLMKLQGFIGTPDSAKKTRGEQYFFINGRFIREPYFHHAVMNAYQELLPADSIPFYALFIEIDPAKIDINIHPSKTEVKFEDEKVLYAILRAAIKRSLGQHILSPSLDFTMETGLAEVGYQKRTQPVQAPTINFNPDYNPFKIPAEDRKVSIPGNWQDLYKIAEEQPAPPTLFQEDTDTLKTFQQSAEPEKKPFQLNQRFMVSSIKSGLLVIDQESAHERILYEEYLEALSGHGFASQQTLFPQTISFSSADASLLEELLPEIRQLGFDIRAFGKNTYVIEGVPADLGHVNEPQILEKLLESYKENLSALKLEKRDNLARSLARRASIKTGRKLESAEMNLLIDKLFACAMPSVSPAGKPVFITLTVNELIKRFENPVR